MTPLVVRPWSARRPPGKEQDDGTVVNVIIQAILEISAKGEDDRWIMPEKHDVNESVTIVEQCTAFGNLNIGVSFVLHRKSGVVMPITKFGPEVKAGKNASYWERYLRHLVSTLLIFDERRRADRIIAASPGSNSTPTFAQRRDVSIRQSYLDQPRCEDSRLTVMTIPTRPMLEFRRSSKGTKLMKVSNSHASSCAMSRHRPSPT